MGQCAIGRNRDDLAAEWPARQRIEGDIGRLADGYLCDVRLVHCHVHAHLARIDQRDEASRARGGRLACVAGYRSDGTVERRDQCVVVQVDLGLLNAQFGLTHGLLLQADVAGARVARLGGQRGQGGGDAASGCLQVALGRAGLQHGQFGLRGLERRLGAGLGHARRLDILWQSHAQVVELGLR